MGESTPSGDGLQLRHSLLRHLTSAQIIGQVRRGEMTAVGRGAFAAGQYYRSLRPEQQHTLRAEAAVCRQSTPAVISHISAALRLGIEMWNVPLAQVHLTK